MSDQHTIDFPTEQMWKAPGTSQQAAAEVAHTAGVMRRKVLDALKAHGSMTSDEIAAYLGLNILSIRPRCSELVSKGLVIKTDERRKNMSGKYATVLAAKGNQ